MKHEFWLYKGMKRNLDQMKILSVLIVVGSEIKTWNLT